MRRFEVHRFISIVYWSHIQSCKIALNLMPGLYITHYSKQGCWKNKNIGKNWWMKEEKRLCRHHYCVVVVKAQKMHHQTLFVNEIASGCKKQMVVEDQGKGTKISLFRPWICVRGFFQLQVMQWQTGKREFYIRVLTHSCSSVLTVTIGELLTLKR